MDKNTTSKYKGIAILSVIICHAMGTFAQGRITWFTPLGGVGVAIFLLLSAYGLNESWNKLETGGGSTASLLVEKTVHHSVDTLYHRPVDRVLAVS